MKCNRKVNKRNYLRISISRIALNVRMTLFMCHGISSDRCFSSPKFLLFVTLKIISDLQLHFIFVFRSLQKKKKFTVAPREAPFLLTSPKL